MQRAKKLIQIPKVLIMHQKIRMTTAEEWSTFYTQNATEVSKEDPNDAFPS